MERRNGSAADLPEAHAGGDGAVGKQENTSCSTPTAASYRRASGRAAARRLPGALLDAQVYPITFIWHSDYWTTITNVLRDAISRRRPEGVLDAGKDFMLDRLDDALEPVARLFSGKGAWDEMKDNALAAAGSTRGGARYALNELRRYIDANEDVSVHVVGTARARSSMRRS